MRRTFTAVETELAYLLLGPTLDLHSYERIYVRGRVKECESAIESLRRRQESGFFDEQPVEKYTLTALPDLVAVRVLAFPRARIEDAEKIVLRRIPGWTFDPILSVPSGAPLALKFHGYWNTGDRVRAEIQIVPLLIGLFWEVEHAAIYKPDPDVGAALGTPAMQARTTDVLNALRAFDEEFGRTIEKRFEFLDE